MLKQLYFFVCRKTNYQATFNEIFYNKAYAFYTVQIAS